MRLSLQIPIADSRIFLNRVDTGFITKPSWLLGGANALDNEFVRFFGEIEPRKSSLKNSIFGDNDCDASRVVRFNKSPVFIEGNFKLELRVQKHFDFDSLLAGKFEVSVTNVVPKSDTQLKLTEDRVRDLVKHFLDQEVRVLNPSYKKAGNLDALCDCKLYQLPNYLPDAYCKASTRAQEYNKIEPWWVQSGKPCLFLEIKGNEEIELPSQWKNVIWQSGFMKKFDFYHATINYHGQNITILIFKGVSNKDYQVAREVRFFALDFLAANECLNIFRIKVKKSY